MGIVCSGCGSSLFVFRGGAVGVGVRVRVSESERGVWDGGIYFIVLASVGIYCE